MVGILVRRGQADAGERAVVELPVTILDDRNDVVVAQKVSCAPTPVTRSGNAAYVQSLDRAFETVVQDIVGRTLSRIRPALPDGAITIMCG